MGDSGAGIRPLPLVEVQEVISDNLLKISEFEFLAWGPMLTIQIVGIEKTQLYQMEDGLFGPSVSSSCSGIIIDHLIKLVDTPPCNLCILVRVWASASRLPHSGICLLFSASVCERNTSVLCVKPCAYERH